MYSKNVRVAQGPLPALDGEGITTSGTTSITNGASSVTISGLGLVEAPSQVLITVRQPNTTPAGDYVIFGTVEADSISSDGFTVELSAATDSTGYKLDYVVI